VLLEYAKASFEHIKQRFGHLWALARVKRVPNDYNRLDISPPRVDLLSFSSA
jgi:hypothetical protein